MAFTHKSNPDQQGKTFVVTGANAGLGYETALALAKQRATVVLACRSQQKAQTAISKIRAGVAGADVHFIEIDLTDFASVRRFATDFTAQFSELHGLVNNAGVMLPRLDHTDDGFELQMTANYFGHFLLTGLLLETLLGTENSRIISLSSIAHLNGQINFNDIHWQQSSPPFKPYQQSKLACLMFDLELQRRLESINATTISVAAHPGVSLTELSRHIPRLLYVGFLPAAMMISHAPRNGALPILLAATADGVKGGDYYGPTGFREMKGMPGKARIARRAKNAENIAKLWALTEQITEFEFPI